MFGNRFIFFFAIASSSYANHALGFQLGARHVVAKAELHMTTGTTPDDCLPQAEAIAVSNGLSVSLDNHRSLVLDDLTGIDSKTKSSALKKWLRRLNTDQDALSLHKWANFGYVVSSTAIVGAGSAIGFHTVPDFMEPLTYILLVSTLGQAITGIRMAAIYRRNDVQNRNVFIASSIQTLQLPFIALWIAPFSPPALGNHFFTFSIFVLYSIISMAANLYQIKIKDQKDEFDSIPYWLNVVMGGGLFFLPFQIWSFVMLGHDRQWYIDACLNDSVPFAPHVDLALSYYALILSTFPLVYGSFLTSLLIKQLIKKEAVFGCNVLFCGFGAYTSMHALGYI